MVHHFGHSDTDLFFLIGFVDEYVPGLFGSPTGIGYERGGGDICLQFLKFVTVSWTVDGHSLGGG